MRYSEYSYSAATQARFYEAEVELLRLGDRLTHNPCARYMRGTLLAFDAIFAVYMSHDTVLPAVPLIVSYDLSDWKYHGDIESSVRARYSRFQFPKDSYEAAVQALHYMQAIEWIAENTHRDTIVTVDTVLRLHEILLSGMPNDNRYHGFRSSFLPHKKGIDPSLITMRINELCHFINSDLFSPLGQASVIHHAFESMVPFDSMIDRTGLALAFLAMFKRGLFPDGYMVPICWGASFDKEYRRKLKDASRNQDSIEIHEQFKEDWAVYNARNTHAAVIITDSFLTAVGRLRTEWRSQNLRIPSNSALDRVMDLFLCVPGLSTIRASETIGKSYGATNEAMRQLAEAGIIKEVAIDGRERIFICDQSATLITKFVDELLRVALELENKGDQMDIEPSALTI